MEKAIFYLLLLVLMGCEWQDPTLKTLKNCVWPTNISIITDTAYPRKYTFSLIEPVPSDVKTVTWRVLSGTTILAQTSLTNNQAFIYTIASGGSYSIRAEMESLCGDKNSISKVF